MPLSLSYRLIRGDCCQVLKALGSGSVDCVVTDPPYGMSFMGKDWDKALPPKEAFSEVFRVLKSGALAFVMSSPRQDLLWRTMSLLEGVGFELMQSPIYWAYASGFPKAYDVGKGIDKKLGFEPTVIGEYQHPDGKPRNWNEHTTKRHGKYSDIKTDDSPNERILTKGSSELAIRWDGWKSQTGLKPAVEVILMVNKPRSEKTIVDNVLKHGTGAVNVDACRIPINPEVDDMLRTVERKVRVSQTWEKGSGFKNEANPLTGVRKEGRFPANLLVSDDVLDDGKIHKSGKMAQHVEGGQYNVYGKHYPRYVESIGDSGSFSRFFSLDAWWLDKVKTFPFLVVPKASKSERDEGLLNLPLKKQRYQDGRWGSHEIFEMEGSGRKTKTKNRNNHPTVKPLKLMSYLIELGCPVGGTVLDPFVGSGTTLVASYLMGKSGIGIEVNEEYSKIADAKMRHHTGQVKLDREVIYVYEEEVVCP